jgi:hypothetical protein
MHDGKEMDYKLNGTWYKNVLLLLYMASYMTPHGKLQNGPSSSQPCFPLPIIPRMTSPATSSHPVLVALY